MKKSRKGWDVLFTDASFAGDGDTGLENDVFRRVDSTTKSHKLWRVLEWIWKKSDRQEWGEYPLLYSWVIQQESTAIHIQVCLALSVCIDLHDRKLVLWSVVVMTFLLSSWCKSCCAGLLYPVRRMYYFTLWREQTAKRGSNRLKVKGTPDRQT
jgi:hypothetical protein